MELNRDLRLEELQNVCHCCLMACSDFGSLLNPSYNHPKRQNDEKFVIASQLYAECVGSSEIQLDYEYPLKICHECYEKLKEYNLFRSQCLRALKIFNSVKRKAAETIEHSYELFVPSDKFTIKEEQEPIEDDPQKSKKRAANSLPTKPKAKKEKTEHIVSNDTRTVNIEPDPVCNSTRKDKKCSSILLQKKKQKDKKRPIMCQICGIMQTNMTTHMQVHAEKCSFECDLCGKHFAQKMNLNTHLLRHVNANVRRFSCEICGYAFLQKSVMQRHMLIHTNTRAFACDMCPRTFIQQGSMHKHRLAHMQVRNFVCPHCDKAFVGKAGLRNHIGIHTGQREFGCFFCSKTFFNTSSATMHRKIHRIDGVYECPACSSFRSGDLRLFKMHWHQNHQRTPGEMKSIGEMMYSDVEMKQQSKEINVW